MKIQENSIILAPSNLHLAIYQKILKEKNNCINIQVSSLSTYIHSFMTIDSESIISILYIYRKKLIQLSKENAYKESVNDIQFLSSCLSFIRWMKLYNQTIQDLKGETKKEKDIKEVLSLIFDVPVFEDNTTSILDKLSNQDHIYIVNKEMNKLETFWKEVLIQKGAHIIEEGYTPDIHYYSVANNKKQAELIARTIIQDDLDADDIFISCNNDGEKQTLGQILDLYKIPYTYLSQRTVSSVPREWVCALNWVKNKNISTFLTLVETLYKNDYNYINLYYTLFPEQFKNPSIYLNALNYQKNNLIEENEFNQLKELEKKVYEWKEKHRNLYTWTYNDFEKIAKEIQNTHAHVEKEDVSIFKKINQYCIDATPFIQSEDDLSILIQKIDEESSSSNTNEIKGVLIGNKKEITSIRPVLFLMGAHSKNYPSPNLESGLFDEVYLRTTSLPSLEKRLEQQKAQMKSVLLDHTVLYILYAQSDYEGKSYTNSSELEEWIGINESTFKSIPDHSIHRKEQFILSENTTNSLFFNQNRLSVSRMETYSKCPLQHFLKYGLRLNEPREITDVATRGTVLHSILERSTNELKKNYINLTKEEIHSFVEAEFEFYSKVYPAKKDWIQTQIKDYANTVELVLSQLKFFETSWHMVFHEPEHKFIKTIEWNGMTIELVGYVDRIDTSATSFCIFDYKSSKKVLSVDKFQSGLSLQLLTYTLAYADESNLQPVGNFYITLKVPYTDTPAIKVKYSKKEDNAIVNDIENDDEFIQQNVLNGWGFDGLDVYLDENPQVKEPRAKLTISEIKEQWPIIIEGILNDMANGNVSPNHTQEACKYCKFERICRNAREEISKESYIKEAD